MLTIAYGDLQHAQGLLAASSHNKFYQFQEALVNDPGLKAGAWIWTPPQFEKTVKPSRFGFRIRPIRAS